MFAICNTKGVVLAANLSDKAAAESKALEIAKERSIVTVIRTIPDKVTVRQPITARVDHKPLVEMVLGKKRSDGKRKVLRIGTHAEVATYIAWFLKNRSYSPVIRRWDGTSPTGAYVR